MQMNAPHQQQMIRARHPPGGPVHQQQSPQQQNRSPKKRPSFEANAGGNAPFKQVRFDAAAKRKKVFLCVYSLWGWLFRTSCNIEIYVFALRNSKFWQCSANSS
jgi:hypothetical protein